MGALNPIFLVAAAAVAVPLFLHLFQRHETRRLSFPALRYLERTEREHAREIRLRQLLLLLTRVAVLLLLVGAGARLFFQGRGSAHPPTAVAIVLDNSMSSGLVVGESRVLDGLKEIAYRTLDAAGAEDRFWIVRAGEPWLPAIPGPAAVARVAVESTEPSAARGDLEAALQRAAELVATSDLEAREIHLLSDLQDTSFPAAHTAPAGDLTVVVWTAAPEWADNAGLAEVVVGGGLSPLEGQRSEVTVRALPGTDTVPLAVRLVVGERIRGAASIPPGASASITLAAAGSDGWQRGWVETEADALRADDRLYFAFRSRPPPGVAVAGDAGLFVTEGLAVLEAAGRAQRTAPGQAQLLVAAAGDGLELLGPDAAALVVPPSDPTLLPALNRRLADAGIPWRFEARRATGEANLEGRSLPAPLEGVRVHAWLDLLPVGDPTAPTRTLAEVGGGTWAVQGVDAGGRRYLLLASPLDAESSSLPVSTAMPRFLDWAASEWAGASGGAASVLAGTSLPAPGGATRVRFPSGEEREIDGTRVVRGTGEPGFYTFLDAADQVVAYAAVNPAPSESRLVRLERADLESAVGASVVAVDDPDAWTRAVYRERQGPEVWWPLLLGALALLVFEAAVAASGGRQRAPAPRPAGTAATHAEA